MNNTHSAAIVELRQYLLHPAQREVLIELFEREFIQPQEALGMQVIGQFRDLDRPDYFVWLRGFTDMASRAPALGAFYGGPVWQAQRNAANATMIDSDNVLLLRPARPETGFVLKEDQSPASGLCVASIYALEQPAEGGFVDFFEQALRPLILAAGAKILGYFVSENSPNNFPALPVREGEQVFVCFAGFRDAAAYERYALPDEIAEALAKRIKGRPEVLRLAPTAHSRLKA